MGRIKIGEYWLLPDGSRVFADGDVGDYNHEGYVVSVIIDKICDFLDIQNTFDDDGAMFRCTLGDHIYPERYGWDEEDPHDRLAKELVKARVFKQDEIEDVFSAFTGNTTDARALAINRWKWIRIAGPNAEVPSMDENTLAHLGNGLLDIIDDEGHEIEEERLMGIQINVSTYRGRASQNQTIKLGQLLSGEHGESGSEFAASARDALRRADVAMQPAFYGNKLGDSLRLISNLLS